MITEFLLLIGVMLLFLGLGTPIFASMAFASAAYILAFWPKVPVMVVAQSFVHGLDNYNFAAIVFFFLAGEIMNAGGISKRLLDFMRACFGPIRGGLSHINIVANMVFSGVSGSALADASAVGSMLIPAMKREGYPGAYAAAVTAAAATLGPTIPPSIPMVVFGLFAMTSIGKLFLAGVVPGVLMGGFLLAASYLLSRARSYPKTPWMGWNTLARAGWRAILALLLPAIVVVGLVSGVATVTEIGALAAAYALLVACIYREIALAQLWQVFCKVGIDSCRVLVILSVAGLFIWIVGNMGIASALAEWIASVTSDPRLVLGMIALGLVLGGCVLDPVTLFVVFVPVLIPTATAVGIDLTHLGLVTVVATGIAVIMPPMGVLVYLTSTQAGVSADLVFKELVPFIAALVLLLVVLVLFPQLSLWLPSRLMP